MLSLPVDVQVLILPLLNFTTLISLSQTNRHFRQLIDPQKEHFIGRLLELECLPENGGEVIPFPYTINPRYTCAHCIKLLSHTKFDNHSLLRHRYRKPPLNTTATCNWTSGDAKARGLHRQAQIRAEKQSLIAQKEKEKEIPDHHFYFPLPTLRPTQPPLDVLGTSRHKRMCNSCRFATGFWAQNVGVRDWGKRNANSNVGSATVPVIKNRKRVYHDASERFFPGLFPYDGQYPSVRRVYRERDLGYAIWTLYSVRCPRCEVWREFAAFGRPAMHKACPADAPEWDIPNWEPNFEEWRCNWCVAEMMGKEELWERLLEFWKHVTNQEIDRLEYDVKSGWGWVDEAEWIDVFKKARVESQLWRKIPTPDDIQKIPFPKKRRTYFAIWKQHLQSQGQNFPAGTEGSFFERGANPWFRVWCEEYEIMEKRVEFLRECTKKLEVDQGILLEYALKEESYVEM